MHPGARHGLQCQSRPGALSPKCECDDSLGCGKTIAEALGRGPGVDAGPPVGSDLTVGEVRSDSGIEGRDSQG